jgi:hypothetical protein
VNGRIWVGSLRRPPTAPLTWKGSALGNPYIIQRHGNRDTIIRKYEQWLDRRLADKTPGVMKRAFLTLLELHQDGYDLQLLCWCAPERCHADVIKARLLAAG